LTQISGISIGSRLAPATALAGPSPTPNRWRRSPPGSRTPTRRCLRLVWPPQKR